MAVMIHLATGEPLWLRAPHRFGRSRTNDTLIAAPEISGEHAVVTFGDEWTVRDLGSRNGTFVNGQRVANGARQPLAVGDRVGFGTAESQWEITSVAEPSAWVRNGDRIVEGDGTLLALPSQDDARLLILHDEEEGWTGPDGPVQEGDVFEVDGERWALHLPEILAPTHARGVHDTDLGKLGLRFAVSSDEEYVEVTVRLPTGTHALAPKAHHYLLLTLARARLEDAAAGASEGAAGWRYTEDLQRLLRAAPNHFHVIVHRIRKEFAALPVDDGTAIVERRKVSQQIRIGLAELEIVGI